MQPVSSYGVELQKQNTPARQTLEIYRQAVSYLTEIYEQVWAELKMIPEAKKRFNAAEHLIERDNIDRSSIDGLVFVSSTREWIIPDTAVSLQHRLGLSTETVCQVIFMVCCKLQHGLIVVCAEIYLSCVAKC